MKICRRDSRDFEEAVGEELAKCEDHRHVGIELSQFLDCISAGCLLRLVYGNLVPQRHLFDGRRFQVEVPAAGPVGLRNNADHIDAG